MYKLQCCGCGCDLARQLTEFVDTELDRRANELADGFPWPIIGVMCMPCEVEATAFTDTLNDDYPHV